MGFATENYVIDDVGIVKDVDVILGHIERLTGKNLSLFDLERAFKDSHEYVYFDESGNVCVSPNDSVMKMIKLEGIVSKFGQNLYASLVKYLHKVERLGHGSDECWGNMFVGTYEFLYSKWSEMRSRKEAEAVASKIDKLDSAEVKEAEDELYDLVSNGSAINRLEYKIAGVLLEDIYDLLNDKENWKNVHGSLRRLGNYLKYLTHKLKSDDNVDYVKYNRSKTKVVFNTRLLDKFGNFIIVRGNLINNVIVPEKVVLNSIDLFTEDFDMNDIDVKPARFYNSLNDLVFMGTIDDFDMNSVRAMIHIVEERRSRLPAEFQSLSPLEISTHLNASVNLAIKIAVTDYRFIVPGYNAERNSNCFLIPLYTNFGGSGKPSCAIVVDKGCGKKWEFKTVLNLEQAYYCARLINKQSANWLELD